MYIVYVHLYQTLTSYKAIFYYGNTTMIIIHVVKYFKYILQFH